MEEKEYFDFHLKIIWHTYQKMNSELYSHKNGGVYEDFPRFSQSSNDEFKQLTTYEEFHETVMKRKNHFIFNDEYSQIKNSLFQGLRKLGEPEFMKEYVNEIIFNSPESYSTAFIENRFKYSMHQGTFEYIKELLPQMSHENTLCYFNTIQTWRHLKSIIEDNLPLISEQNNGKELLFTALNNCYEKDKYEINNYAYKDISEFLIKNYSDAELNTFDFLPNIESFLLSKNKTKDIVTNQDEDVITTKISVDCQHARNIYYLEKTDIGNYCALVREFMECLKKDPSYNILNINIIHKYDKDEHGRKGNYQISEVFIDTQEYDPNLKQKVSKLLNRFVKDYIESVRDNSEGMNFEKFKENWLLKENLNLDLEINNNIQQKSKKI